MSDPRPTPWWGDVDWYASVVEWIDAALPAAGREPVGPPETLRCWSLSCVLRVPTNHGTHFFKAVPAVFGAEAALTVALNAWFPESTPTVVAAHPTRSWLLLEDLGDQKLQDQPVEAWCAAARVHARMQIGCLDRVHDLLAAGAADHRPATIAERLDRLIDDAEVCRHLGADDESQLVARKLLLREHCAKLADSPPGSTLVHGDLHAGNVVIHDGRPVIFDWTDAGIGHPFIDLRTLLDAAIEHLPDHPGAVDQIVAAYLDTWTDEGQFGRAALVNLVQLGLSVGALQQALSYQAIAHGTRGHADHDWQKASANYLRRALDPLKLA